jgi:hypothetical protein
VGDKPRKLGRTKRERFFGIATDFTPVVTVKCGRSRVFLSTEDDEAQALFVNRASSSTRALACAVTVLRKLVGESVGGGSTYVEVAAGVGALAILAVQEHGFGSALALEDDPAYHRLLRLNVEVNGLGRRVSAPRAPNPDELVRSGQLEPDRVGVLRLGSRADLPVALEGSAALLDRGVPLMIERPGPSVAAVLADTYTHAVDLGEEAAAGMTNARRVRRLSEVDWRPEGLEAEFAAGLLAVRLER